jgi:hypothetical protein
MNCRQHSMKSNAMIHQLFSILIAISLLAPSAMAAKKKHIELKPKDASNGIAVISMGKNRTYYPLSSKRSSIVPVKGPGELRILTRARFVQRGKGELDYRIIYKVDGADEHTLDVEGVTRSEDAMYKDGTLGVPGDSKDLVIKIGRGYHSIELVLRDSLPMVSARYLFAPSKQKKAKWVALSPLAPSEPVDLFAGEETAHYYRFSKEKPLKIEIIGPTDLRVLTRVENSFDMKGRANYRIQIRQSGQVVQSFQLSSRRSETTTYKNNSKLVPGKAREIVFAVPKGKQQYEIIPLDKGALLGQIMFPQKDTKLGL